MSVEVALLTTNLTGILCIGLFFGLNPSCKSQLCLLNPWFTTQDQHLNFNHLYDASVHMSPDCSCLTYWPESYFKSTANITNPEYVV